MLNIRIYLATVAVLSLAGYGWGLWQHQTGWRDGRNALLAEQSEAAEKLRQENAQRQQVEDAKAAEAEQQGEAKTITITKELIRYVQIPGRNVCLFDDRRLRIKADAVANASNIPGFDDSAVQDAASGK
ncbi:MAG: hypothetical protein ACRCVK_21820 [Aeromonas veronii]